MMVYIYLHIADCSLAAVMATGAAGALCAAEYICTSRWYIHLVHSLSLKRSRWGLKVRIDEGVWSNAHIELHIGRSIEI